MRTAEIGALPGQPETGSGFFIHLPVRKQGQEISKSFVVAALE
jgi:hypothetical protein